MARRNRPDTSNGHRRRQLWARVRRSRDVCQMPKCVAPTRFIDKALKWPHPLSFVVDHIEPVSRRPDLALVLENLRAAHKVCNEKGQPSKKEPSLEWGI